jgi:hypothetical protein
MEKFRIDEPTLNKILDNIDNLSGRLQPKKSISKPSSIDAADRSDLISSLHVPSNESKNFKIKPRLNENLNNPTNIRSLENQIAKWLSFKVSDFTDMTHLKIEIKNQILPKATELSKEVKSKISTMILKIGAESFPNVEIDESELNKWIKHFGFQDLSDEELDSAIRVEVFGKDNIKATSKKEKTPVAASMTPVTLDELLTKLDPNNMISDSDSETLEMSIYGDVGNSHKPIPPGNVGSAERMIKRLVGSNEAQRRKAESDEEPELVPIGDDHLEIAGY